MPVLRPQGKTAGSVMAQSRFATPAAGLAPTVKAALDYGKRQIPPRPSGPGSFDGKACQDASLQGVRNRQARRRQAHHSEARDPEVCSDAQHPEAGHPEAGHPQACCPKAPRTRSKPFYRDLTWRSRIFGFQAWSHAQELQKPVIQKSTSRKHPSGTLLMPRVPRCLPLPPLLRLSPRLRSMSSWIWHEVARNTVFSYAALTMSLNAELTRYAAQVQTNGFRVEMVTTYNINNCLGEMFNH
ncbi:hypothetical protein HDK64DRAFT_295452 [Phyllosticta capitalensis]